jgi:two-component system KDP operon response regulator KdpE
MPIRILSVEDEAVNRALLRAVVKRHPVLSQAQLVEAATLAEARSSVGADRFDLVILDLRLPDGDGLSLARELAGTPDPPAILVLSANVRDDDRRAAAEAGAQAFVGKPYRPPDLLLELDRLLASRVGG